MKHGRHSVRTKLFLITFGAIFGTVALCILLNEVFLVRFYEGSKQKALGRAFHTIDALVSADIAASEAANADGADAQADSSGQADGGESQDQESSTTLEDTTTELSEDTLLELDILCGNQGITAMLVDEVLFFRDRPPSLVKYSFGAGAKDNQDERAIKDLLADYLFPGSGPEIRGKTLKKQTSQYSIYTMYDVRMQSKYIELVGVLKSGDILLMRSNVESMQESVGVANRFLVLVGLFSAILISIIMVFVGRRFTRPLRLLSGIAKQMTELNFSLKYPVRTKDEVGELGESINALASKLEQTISELKSANNELTLDIKKKTEAEKKRKEFLSNVTHELKTPIALIQGYAEGLKDNISESAEDREFYCDVIIDEAAKMNAMVQKLLTLNHLEEGTVQVEFARFDLTELISSVLSSTEILAKQKEVTLIFDGREPVYVWADEYMIEEVLTNYISNAFHHVAGSKAIEVKVIPMGEKVRVAVFNTGETIPEDELPKLWGKFYKVDKARTREYGGSGIGLSIVKAIMETHNQPYGVRNHENGVEFWFELDAKAAP